MTTEVIDLVTKAAGRIETVEEKLKSHSEQLKSVNDSLNDLYQKEGARIMFGDSPGKGSSPISKLFADPSIAAFRKGETKNKVIFNTKAGVEIVTKATLVGDTAGTSEDGFNVQPQRFLGLANDPRRRLSLIESLPRLRVTSNTFEFNALDGYANVAGYQANEGALKPETALPTELKSVSIKTIAHHLPVSEQVLADVPALQQQINSLLRYGVGAKLERELIVGTGSPGQIGGLTDTGNFIVWSPSTSTLNTADKIGEALASLDAAGWAGNLIILHPDDWQAMRSERAETGGEYLAGSWNNPAAPNVWGVPVVTSPHITAGNAIVLDTSQVALLERQDATVQMGWIEDQFARNVVTVRAELRAGLAVFSPTAVYYFEI